jgi:NitT/TauT family transport system substrate-binding protein
MFRSIIKFTARLALASSVALASVAALAAPQEVTYLLPGPPNLPAFAPWMIAQQKGYYADENLKVSFFAANGGVDVATQIGAGNAVIGGAMGDTPIIARANGVPVRAVAVLGAGALPQLVVHADSPIKTVKDLKGKTVTVMSYSDTIYYALLGSLRKAGLGRTDVSAQAAGPAGVWQLFAAGKSEAMAAVPEWIVSAEGAGAKVRLLPGDGFESTAQAILASDKTIQTNPDLVRRLWCAPRCAACRTSCAIPRPPRPFM